MRKPVMNNTWKMHLLEQQDFNGNFEIERKMERGKIGV